MIRAITAVERFICAMNQCVPQAAWHEALRPRPCGGCVVKEIPANGNGDIDIDALRDA